MRKLDIGNPGMKAPALGAALGLALQLGACASPTGGFSYSLPKAAATATIQTALRRCAVKERPGGEFEGFLVFDQEVTIDPSYTADTSATYRINLRSLGGPLKDTEFTAKTYPNGTLQSLGSAVEDKTLEIAESVGRIALSFAGVGSLGVRSDSSAEFVAQARSAPAFCTETAQRVENAYLALAQGRAEQALLLASDSATKEALEASALRLQALLENYSRATRATTTGRVHKLNLSGPATVTLPLPHGDWDAWVKPQARPGAIANYDALRAAAQTVLVFGAPQDLPGLETDAASAGTEDCRTEQGCAFVALAPLSRLPLRVCTGQCTEGSPDEKTYEILVPVARQPQFVGLTPTFFNKVSWKLNFEPSGRVSDFTFGQSSAAGAAEGARTLIGLPEEERNRKIEAEIKRRQLEEQLRQCRADSAKCE